MTVWKIAAGVFLGNLLFGLLAWVAVAFHTQSVEADAEISRTNQGYRDMMNRQAAEQRAGNTAALSR